MMVRVTWRDIQNGRHLDCYGCPIASALSRALGGMFTVSVVSPQEIVIRDAQNKTTLVTFDPPVSVAWFIVDFDRCHYVKPFAFWFDESLIPPSYRDWIVGGESVIDKIRWLMGLR